MDIIYYMHLLFLLYIILNIDYCCAGSSHRFVLSTSFYDGVLNILSGGGYF